MSRDSADSTGRQRYDLLVKTWLTESELALRGLDFFGCVAKETETNPYVEFCSFNAIRAAHATCRHHLFLYLLCQGFQ